MATAYRQTLSDADFEFYFEALAFEADSTTWDSYTLQEARDGSFRDERGGLRFPKLPELRPAYLHYQDAARRGHTTSYEAMLQRSIDRFWQTPAQEERYERIVRGNPRKPGESPLSYIVRLAESAEGPLRPIRTMPEREPGQEG